MTEHTGIEVRQEDGVAVIRMPRYINMDAGEQAAGICDGLLARGVVKLVLNLERTTIANSVGIRHLIEVMAKVMDACGQMAFSNAAQPVARTLKIMGLLEQASLHETEAEAVAAAGS